MSKATEMCMPMMPKLEYTEKYYFPAPQTYTKPQITRYYDFTFQLHAYFQKN